MKKANNSKELKKHSAAQKKAVYMTTLTLVFVAVLIVFHGGQSLERGPLLDRYYFEKIESEQVKAVVDAVSTEHSSSNTLTEAIWVENIKESYGDKDALPSVIDTSYDQQLIDTEYSKYEVF